MRSQLNARSLGGHQYLDVARIWAEWFDHSRHHKPMQGAADEPLDLARDGCAPTLEPHQVSFVRVVGLTFDFHSIERTRGCLTHYERAKPSLSESRRDSVPRCDNLIIVPTGTTLIAP
jgi:hypothetical protein